MKNRIKGKKFAYVVSHNSPKRGKNMMVSVYAMFGKTYGCRLISTVHCDIRAYDGDWATVCRIISDATGYRIDKTGRFVRSDIKVVQLAPPFLG